MTPKSFDLATCKAFIGDERVRHVEGKARADADADAYAPPPHTFQTPAGKAHEDMEDVVYLYAFKKRADRLARMAEKPAQVTAQPQPQGIQ